MLRLRAMIDDMRRQTEDIIRYYGEIDRRIMHVGLDGVVGLLELSKAMETALAVVAPQEIEWVTNEIRGLLDRLVQIDAELQQLKTLKLELADDSDRALARG